MMAYMKYYINFALFVLHTEHLPFKILLPFFVFPSRWFVVPVFFLHFRQYIFKYIVLNVI